MLQESLLCLEHGKERNASYACTCHDEYSVHVLVIIDNVLIMIYTCTCHDKYSVHVLGNVLIMIYTCTCHDKVLL